MGLFWSSELFEKQLLLLAVNVDERNWFDLITALSHRSNRGCRRWLVSCLGSCCISWRWLLRLTNRLILQRASAENIDVIPGLRKRSRHALIDCSIITCFIATCLILLLPWWAPSMPIFFDFCHKQDRTLALYWSRILVWVFLLNVVWAWVGWEVPWQRSNPFLRCLFWRITLMLAAVILHLCHSLFKAIAWVATRWLWLSTLIFWSYLIHDFLVALSQFIKPALRHNLEAFLQRKVGFIVVMRATASGTFCLLVYNDLRLKEIHSLRHLCRVSNCHAPQLIFLLRLVNVNSRLDWIFSRRYSINVFFPFLPTHQ